jgi:hypothetical protein
MPISGDMALVRLLGILPGVLGILGHMDMLGGRTRPLGFTTLVSNTWQASVSA